MARSVTLNGTTYSIPQTGDSGWSQSGGVDDYLVALSAGVLTKAGGTFTLSAEANLGATYGLKVAYLKTQTANPASAGVLRLAKTDTVAWRNNANGADLALAIDGSDNLTFNGTKVGLSGNIVNADISGSAAIAYSKLNLTGAIQNADLAGSIAYSKLTLTGSIVNADVSASAAIAYSKLNLAGAVKLASDVTGLLPAANGGTGVLSTATFPSSGVVVTEAATETLTNKTLTSPVISTIVNTGTLTLPTATDTLVARTTTDTLTNKTISGASNTITNVSLTTGVTGTLPIGNGGTGQTAKTAAYNALTPLTTKGDVVGFDGTNGVRVAVGADGTVLSADSTQTAGLKWVSPLTNPMTTTGDIIVGGAAGAATRLAIGASGTVLKGGSTPSYATIVNADVSSSAAIAGSKLQAASTSNVGTVSFESSGTFNCTVGGPFVNATITVAYSRVGGNVSLRFQARRVAGSSSANPFTLDFTNMPATLRPTADQVFASVLVTDAGTDQANPGVVTIPTIGNGTLTKSGATTNFTSTASTVGFYAFSVSYTVQ